QDLFRSQAAQTRRFFNSKAVLANFDKAERFSRKTWGLISLEISHQLFYDRAAQIRCPSDVAQQPLGSSELVECGTLRCESSLQAAAGRSDRILRTCCSLAATMFSSSIISRRVAATTSVHTQISRWLRTQSLTTASSIS